MKSTTRGHGLDLHAPGAIDALLAFHRAHFGDARMEADPDGDPDGGDPKGTGDPDGDGGGDGGDPRPKAEDTVEYWRKRSRQHEGEAKRLREAAGKSGGTGEGERPKAEAPRGTDDSAERAVRKARLVAVKGAAVEAGVNPRLITALVASNRSLLEGIELDDLDDPSDPDHVTDMIKRLVEDYSLPTTASTAKGSTGSGRKHPTSGADGGSRPPAASKSERDEDADWEKANGYR